MKIIPPISVDQFLDIVFGEMYGKAHEMYRKDLKKHIIKNWSKDKLYQKYLDILEHRRVTFLDL